MWNTLPDLTKICARGANTIGGFGLVTPAITRAYHCADLAGPPLCCAITNHYRPRVKYTHNDRNNHIPRSDSGPPGIRPIPTEHPQKKVVGDGGAKHRYIDPPTEPHNVPTPHAVAKVHTVAGPKALTPHSDHTMSLTQ